MDGGRGGRRCHLGRGRPVGGRGAGDAGRSDSGDGSNDGQSLGLASLATGAGYSPDAGGKSTPEFPGD